MTYSEAIEWLNALTDFERLGFRRHFAEAVNLDAARAFMEIIDNPHLKVPCIHIAGTKGKGSSAAMLESVLRSAGYKTGLFTSPHLVSFRERVRICGEPVPEDAIADLVQQVQPAVEAVRDLPGLSPCTFFETYLGMAALYFTAQKVDIAIWETGLGGRLDATNLVTPLVAAITTIGIDHTAILGETLDLIAREKAGIAKPGVPLVVADGQMPEAMAAIREIAQTVGSPLCMAPQVKRIEPPQKATYLSENQFQRPLDKFEVAGAEIFQTPLVGAHQAKNLGVVLGILEQMTKAGYTVGKAAVHNGLQNVTWPGRFDIRSAKPWLLFDCAHNPESGRALALALSEYLPAGPLALVIGMSEDKDIAGFAEAFSALQPQVFLTQAQNPRALDAHELKVQGGIAWETATVTPDALEALTAAKAAVGAEGTVCVAGSFYVVGEIMERTGLVP